MKSSTKSDSKNYKVFSVTLTLPPNSIATEKVDATTEAGTKSENECKLDNSNNKYNNQCYDKKSELKRQWDSICRKWGMIVVRELVYIQNTILEDDLLLTEKNGRQQQQQSGTHFVPSSMNGDTVISRNNNQDNCYSSNSNDKEQNLSHTRHLDKNHIHTSSTVNFTTSRPTANTSSNHITVDGCEATKVKDQLVVSEIIMPQDADAHHSSTTTTRNPNKSSSAAYNAGIQTGDIIHAIYGMKNPKLGLLFGIMRDSITFQ